MTSNPSRGPLDDYGPGDIEYYIAHDDTILAQISDFSDTVTQPKAPTGTGLGSLKNVRHKRTGPPEGTFSMTRAALKATEKGELFMRLLLGANIIITEFIASASTTHTPGQTMTDILEIRTKTTSTQLLETTDYTVNWTTGVITFNTALTEDAEIKYASDDSDWLGRNLMQNTGMEDVITNIWSGEGTGTVTRDTTSVYVGTYGLNVTVGAQNDGAQYDPNIPVKAGRTYRLTAWVYGVSAADDFGASWTDAGGTVAMTPVGTANVLANASWKLHEFTFTPDENTILEVLLLNTDAAASSNFYVDEIYLRENDPKLDVMDAGLNCGFQFQVIARRVKDQAIIVRWTGCEVYDDGLASGDPTYTEPINGQFLGKEILGV
jgi:hypothetical protein